jgi:hypothetical protein
VPETFFLKGADCWGWATWRRGWELFESDGKKLLRQLKDANLLRRFDFDGAYSYSKMLKDQIKGKNNSWAVRWYASALLQDKLTLYPGKSFLKNIGLDASGTHHDNNNAYCTELTETPVIPRPINIIEDEIAYYSFRTFFRSSHIPFHKKIHRCLMRLQISKFIPTIFRRWYRLILNP